MKINVIWGAPESGKTTYVNEHKAENNLIFDFDLLMRDLSGLSLYERNEYIISYITDFRQTIVNRMDRERNIDSAWMIISYPADPLKMQLEDLGAEFILMKATRQECLDRLALDEARKDKSEWAQVINDWFDRYEDEYGNDQNSENFTERRVVNMSKRFWNFVKNEDTGSAELRIDGDIISDDDAWLYEWFDIKATAPNAFREALKDYDGQPIDVWIDSYGGDVFAAAGIYNALKAHNGKVTTKIDGKAMSAASVIAMAGDEVLMSPLAVMMIHNPLSAAQGYASDLRKQAEVLDTVKETIINAYQAKTHKSRSKLSALMDDETYMDSKLAIKNGFADGELNQDKQPAAVNMAFNRYAIVNSAKLSMRRLVDFEKMRDVQNAADHQQQDREQEKQALLDELDLI
ncbi:head maturation protease, ClpP-related [Sporolactobacillus kofuensis]|uniref:ATP-dependent Clp protease proteolytic subunit n=1 Tax=Sporolactobacillus kofuensis TaxID=269672 RepID=A0ABW1W9T6_9BACL|nr:head maturation protease, ClpP-related [Sporolactobacillus kofuensis]MCO7175553.1 Clp protease ClpP [Sporolactobacillus kofuensis]